MHLSRTLWLACLPLIGTLACIEPQVIQNYPDYQPQHRIAIIRKSGFTVAVSESQRWGDTLQLTPGRYLLEFREKYTGIKGAAICQVEPGGIYEIEIVRKRYLEMSGRYVYEGKCNRLNEPAEPGQYEFPEDQDKKEPDAENPLPDKQNERRSEDSEVRPLAPEEEDITSDDPVLNPYKEPEKEESADQDRSQPDTRRKSESDDSQPDANGESESDTDSRNKSDGELDKNNPDGDSEFQARLA